MKDKNQKITHFVITEPVTVEQFRENIRDKSNDRKFAELEKRITELEEKIKTIIIDFN
jgi:hypothetical protein